MLRELQVRRLAVIDDLRVEFGPGLNVLSGETGAGKSILVTAIGLALGWRAAADMIRTGCDDAEVVAVFDNPGGETAAALRELEIAPAAEIRVERFIQSAGRNRVAINGAAAPLAGLRRVGETLLNLYGQHEAQGLMRPESHLHVLDEYAGLGADRERVGELARALKAADARLAELRRKEAERDARLGYLRYLMQEIDAAAFADGEDEQLAIRVKALANAEHLLQLAHRLSDELYDRETGSLAEIAGELRREVEARLDVDPRLAPIAAGLQEMAALADDLASRGRDYAEELEFDPARLAQLEDRLQALRELKKKYGGSLAEVRRTRAAAETEAAALEQLAGDIQGAGAERLRLVAALGQAAAKLTEARRAASGKMAREVERELADLDMAGTKFVAPVEPLAAGGVEIDGRRIDETGADQIEFLISANVGELPRALARIASGGELSRLMLAIKRVLSRHFPVPTLIFDEIDAGVGGAQAERLGRKLQETGRDHQVLCITHLPQIAALADAHYLVAKTIRKGRTVAAATPLDEPERVEELARMLGGETVTAAAREAARALLFSAAGAARPARQRK
jgi:DNA repair protein RecN (Recombination protein N)